MHLVAFQEKRMLVKVNKFHVGKLFNPVMGDSEVRSDGSKPLPGSDASGKLIEFSTIEDRLETIAAKNEP